MVDREKDHLELAEKEKRQLLLERNRRAAFKCRQRKKEWIAQLQGSVELLTAENAALKEHVTQFREEIINLKTVLLAHADCPMVRKSRPGLVFNV
ncbi:hypothetical protein DFQ29_007631 [Apophysomyces sp. BC1021]|nr:hypothetical protein DFQ29_007631 [Apophysomyces sp. BC1021]